MALYTFEYAQLMEQGGHHEEAEGLYKETLGITDFKVRSLLKNHEFSFN